jgi:phosphoglycolate phosphatase-like HAD superfamily hydrolase
MPAPAACLFDLDGLLLDTEPLHGRAWREAAARFGTQLDPNQLLALRGRRRHDCADQVLAWIRSDGGHCPGRQELLAVRQPIAEVLLAAADAGGGGPVASLPGAGGADGAGDQQLPIGGGAEDPPPPLAHPDRGAGLWR